MKKKIDEIKIHEHVTIAGSTGSGKTELAKVYLAGENFPNVIVYDTKRTFKWAQVPDAPIFESLSQLMKFQGGKCIYRPTIEELEDKKTVEAFFKWIFLRGNTIVFIDELSMITTSSQVPMYLKAIWQQGRELNVSCWACCQRPKNVPLIAFSEATHFFIFSLNLEADRKRVNEIIGSNKVLNIIPEKHYFWYYKMGMKEPIYATLKL